MRWRQLREALPPEMILSVLKQHAVDLQHLADYSAQPQQESGCGQDSRENEAWNVSAFAAVAVKEYQPAHAQKNANEKRYRADHE